jgi:DNA-binding transcriptional LysR family regulator
MFVRIIQTGFLTAVAKVNNVTAALVSRAVTSPEQQLRTVAPHRTSRHLPVTEPGGRFDERAKAILAAIDPATDEARSAGVSPAGRLRLHCAPGIAIGTLAT